MKEVKTSQVLINNELRTRKSVLFQMSENLPVLTEEPSLPQDNSRVYSRACLEKTRLVSQHSRVIDYFYSPHSIAQNVLGVGNVTEKNN